MQVKGMNQKPTYNPRNDRWKDGSGLKSPTPWKVEEIVKPYENSYIVMDSSGDCIIHCIRKDNAEYIVTAVNSYIPDKKQLALLAITIVTATDLLGSVELAKASRDDLAGVLIEAHRLLKEVQDDTQT
jgi:hypothetical protein